MSQPPTLLGWTLLMTLLLLPRVPTKAEPGKVVLQAFTEVTGHLGDTVTLPCHLQPLESETWHVTQITWKRLDPLGNLSTVAEFHWERGPSNLETDRVEFVAAKLGAELLDASLTIRDLRIWDEDNYTCEIHISTFQKGSASTWLQVLYAPQVSIALYDTWQQGCRETRMTCDTHSNPEPKSYNWNTTTGLLPRSAVPHDTQLWIQAAEESINTTFICQVSNDLGTGQATMRVLLPGSLCESSHSSLALKICLPIAALMFVAALGALVYFRCLKQTGQAYHTASDHEAAPSSVLV